MKRTTLALLLIANLVLWLPALFGGDDTEVRLERVDETLRDELPHFAWTRGYFDESAYVPERYVLFGGLDPDGAWANVYVAWYPGGLRPSDHPHPARVCYPAQGFAVRELDDRHTVDAGGTRPLVVERLVVSQQNEPPRAVYSWVQGAGDGQSSGPPWLTALSRLWQPAPPRIAVRVETAIGDRDTPRILAAAVRAAAAITEPGDD